MTNVEAGGLFYIVPCRQRRRPFHFLFFFLFHRGRESSTCHQLTGSRRAQYQLLDSWAVKVSSLSAADQPRKEEKRHQRVVISSAKLLRLGSRRGGSFATRLRIPWRGAQIAPPPPRLRMLQMRLEKTGASQLHVLIGNGIGCSSGLLMKTRPSPSSGCVCCLYSIRAATLDSPRGEKQKENRLRRSPSSSQSSWTDGLESTRAWLENLVNMRWANNKLHHFKLDFVIGSDRFKGPEASASAPPFATFPSSLKSKPSERVRSIPGGGKEPGQKG